MMDDGSQENLNTTQKSAELMISKITKHLAEAARSLTWIEKIQLTQAIRLKFEEIDKVMNSDLPLEEKVNELKRTVFKNGINLDKNKEKAFNKSLEKALGKRVEEEVKLGNITEESAEKHKEVKANIQKKKFKFAPSIQALKKDNKKGFKIK